MEKKLKVGVFGAARGMTMIRVLAKHPDAELTAVCDKYEPLLEKVKAEAAEAGVSLTCYTDFEEFFKHPMDAVVLANYANEHAPFAVRLLRSGRHVLSEVLPCETMAQAVELIEAVEETGLVYAYAENYCYMTHTFEMWQRYKKGDIGEITYAEGEYIHDCSSIWPQITYGERNHWRNQMYCTFYCTHSFGPPMMISGLRPVKVSGFEMPATASALKIGMIHGAGIEMITLENGAVVKSIHGALKREPSSVNYELYGTEGMMESDRWDSSALHIYQESDKLCEGEHVHYHPQKNISPELAEKFGTHGGSDFYATHFFLQKILGRPDGMEYSIDVYHAVDMGICGILAYRSILDGGKPVDVPNLRLKEERDKWRNDHACTTPKVAGDQLLPVSSFDYGEVPDEVFEYIRDCWQKEIPPAKMK